MPPSSLAGARAAVLARLWGALAREPIAGLGPREAAGEELAIKLPDGRIMTGPAHLAQPFAVAPDGFAVTLDETPYPDPGRLIRSLMLPGHAERLAVELDDSVANLALARSAQPAPDDGPAMLCRALTTPDPLAYLEQSVVDGHPLHPCCRTRLGLNQDEVRRYAPEHRPVVGLVEYQVPATRWLGVNCPPLLLVHPWQRNHVLPAHPFLRPTGRVRPARPLMSLRTLALADPATDGSDRHHVKTAVSVQMTSAVRILSPAAVHNGPVVSALLAGLADRTTGFTLCPEYAAGAVLVDGEPCRDLAVVHRRIPATAPGTLTLPLAALTAPSAADGRPVLVEVVRHGYSGDPAAFVRELARVLLPPLLTLLHLGVALEAHGQNLLGEFRGGRLVGLRYRDLGGVRISPVRLRRHGIEAPALRGDLACDEPEQLRTKLFASMVATVFAELITVLGRDCGHHPDAAWAIVAAQVRSVRAHLPVSAGADLDGLIGATLPVKATTAMRLADEPLRDLWATVANPMAGLS